MQPADERARSPAGARRTCPYPEFQSVFQFRFECRKVWKQNLIVLAEKSKIIEKN
jgi:hypothetical protein